MNPPLHPVDRCAFCGATREQAVLHTSIHKETYAPCLICTDSISCVARLSEQRRRQRIGETRVLPRDPRPATSPPEDEDVRAA